MTEFIPSERFGFPLFASLAGPAEVAVVGAGISGLACASALAAQGFGVRVFDETRELGGRIATRQEGDLEFDFGAQYFTVRHPAFEEKVEQWLRSGLVTEWNGLLRVVEDGEIRELAGETTRYVGVPTMSSIAWALGESLQIQSGSKVRQVQRRRGAWRVTTEAGDQFGPFDVAVLALPAPQAALLLPPAPHLAGRAAQVRMRPVWSVMAAFETPLNLPFDGAFIHGSELSWAARNASKPGRGPKDCWVVHASHDWSEEHLEDSPEAVSETLLGVLGRLMGQTLPTPGYRASYLWRYAEAEDLLRERCLFDARLAVGACGDWCGGRRVEGAFLSGHALALQIIERWTGGGRRGGGGVGVA